jgi:glycosyltransferase involved in cell wall biosynthesis
MSDDTVTIGVPVYRGELFLEETLRCIQNQTHCNIVVIISLDGPEPASEEICRPFLEDKRFRLVIQPKNLGWVGNINWLMGQVESPYWCYQQQDDLIDSRYLEVLVDYASRAPEAAVVYCDIEAFGLENWKLAQPSVTGSASARQLALLYAHHPAIAFRGLTRLEALRHAGGIRTNEIENYSADTTWMAAVARWGELHRVAVELYRKRYHPENTHMKWWAWPIQKKEKAWIVHCADMLEQAMLVEAAPQERRLLWFAAIARLAPGWMSLFLPVDDLRGSLLEGFLNYVKEKRSFDIPSWLDSNWNELEQSTRSFYWRPTGLRHQMRRVKSRLRGPRNALLRRFRRS